MTCFGACTTGRSRSPRPAWRGPLNTTSTSCRPHRGREGVLVARLQLRHCERSAAIHSPECGVMDCFVALLLAMTITGSPRRQLALRLGRKFSFTIKVIWPVQSHLQKYSPSRFTQSPPNTPPPPPTPLRIHTVTTADC